jgi:hypothetical protein
MDIKIIDMIQENVGSVNSNTYLIIFDIYKIFHVVTLDGES